MISKHLADRLSTEHAKCRRQAHQQLFARARSHLPSNPLLDKSLLPTPPSLQDLESLLSLLLQDGVQHNSLEKCLSLIALSNFIGNIDFKNLPDFTHLGPAIVQTAERYSQAQQFVEASAFLLYNLSFTPFRKLFSLGLRSLAIQKVRKGGLKQSARDDLIHFIGNCWAVYPPASHEQQVQAFEASRDIIAQLVAAVVEAPFLISAAESLCRVRDGAEYLFQHPFMKSVSQALKRTGAQNPQTWHKYLLGLLNLVAEQLSSRNRRQVQIYLMLTAGCKRLDPAYMQTYLLMISCESNLARVDEGQLFITTWVFFVEQETAAGNKQRLKLALQALIAFLYEGQYLAEQQGLCYNRFLRALREVGGMDLLYGMQGPQLNKLVDTIDTIFVDYGA